MKKIKKISYEKLILIPSIIIGVAFHDLIGFYSIILILTGIVLSISLDSE